MMPRESKSYGKLLEYCQDNAWQDEGMEEMEVWTAHDSKHTCLLSSAPESDLEEVEELKDACKVMCTMPEEYAECAECPLRTSEPYVVIADAGCFAAERGSSQALHVEKFVTCSDWLTEHYEAKPDVSVAREAMYKLYLDFCEGSGQEPANRASFGKAVRSTFRGIKTRRLGVRGQSKYHHYGIAVKENSPYRDILLSCQRPNNEVTSPSACVTSQPPHQSLSHSPVDSKREWSVRALIHGFPTLDSIRVPKEIKLQFEGLLNQYTSHCEQLLKVALRKDFDDVERCVRQFWLTLRPELKLLTQHPLVCDVIKLCDLQLYKTVTYLLVPNFTESLPQSLISSIRNFSRNLVVCTEEVMKSYPQILAEAKCQGAKSFAEKIARKTSLAYFSPLVQAMLRNSDDVQRMSRDWKSLNYSEIAEDVRECVGAYVDVKKCLCELERLFARHVSLQKYLTFAEDVWRFCSTHCPNGGSINEEEEIETRGREFIMKWCLTLRVILRDLTTNNSPSLGKLHLLGSLLTDYVMLLIDDERQENIEARIKARLHAGEPMSLAAVQESGQHKQSPSVSPCDGPIRAGATADVNNNQVTSEVGSYQNHGSDVTEFCLPRELRQSEHGLNKFSQSRNQSLIPEVPESHGVSSSRAELEDGNTRWLPSCPNNPGKTRDLNPDNILGSSLENIIAGVARKVVAQQNVQKSSLGWDSNSPHGTEPSSQEIRSICATLPNVECCRIDIDERRECTDQPLGDVSGEYVMGNTWPRVSNQSPALYAAHAQDDRARLSNGIVLHSGRVTHSQAQTGMATPPGKLWQIVPSPNLEDRACEGQMREPLNLSMTCGDVHRL